MKSIGVAISRSLKPIVNTISKKANHNARQSLHYMNAIKRFTTGSLKSIRPFKVTRETLLWFKAFIAPAQPTRPH